jgi:hypothetical protein
MPSQEFTNSGSWVWPTGVTTADQECWGGGGGGGNGIPGKGGGGGGAYSKSAVTKSAAQTDVVIGNGGAIATSGTATTCKQGATTDVSAAPGTGQAGSTGGAGGTTAASVGTTKFAGGKGGDGGGVPGGGGGGGGSGGTTSTGNNGANRSGNNGGAGATAVAGGYNGGKGGNSAQVGSQATDLYSGGGGGGGNGANSATGRPGRCLITWNTPISTVYHQKMRLSQTAIDCMLLGFAISGDIGGLTTYTNRRGRKIWYDFAPPDKPPSWNQIRQRGRFIQAAANWLALTLEQRRQWQRATQIVGHCATGMNAAMQYALRHDTAIVTTIERQSGITLTLPAIVHD